MNNLDGKEKFALITGASMGLGRELAFELAKRKINLVLVSLGNEGLDDLCKKLKEYGIKVHFFETDLTRRVELLELTSRIKGSYNLNILINNAGVGGSKEFEKTDITYIDSIIDLNIRALVLTTRELLPVLKKNKPSYILNVSSMASFSPIGFKTIYPASKVFIDYFTRGLAEELKGTGISASVVHPGPMKTNMHVIKRINKHGFLGRMGVMSPEKVAEIAVNKMFRRRSSILAGTVNRLNFLLIKILPSCITLPLLTKAVKKEIQKDSE